MLGKMYDREVVSIIHVGISDFLFFCSSVFFFFQFAIFHYPLHFDGWTSALESSSWHDFRINLANFEIRTSNQLIEWAFSFRTNSWHSDLSKSWHALALFTKTRFFCHQINVYSFMCDEHVLGVTILKWRHPNMCNLWHKRDSPFLIWHAERWIERK